MAPNCERAADRGEHRQAAGVIVLAVAHEAEDRGEQ
jgi:hypothetical protein